MKTRLLWISCFSYGLIAFTLVILGAVLPELLAHYSQSYSNGGILVFSQFMGFLIGVLTMPLFVKKLGRVNVVLLGLAMISCELFIFFLPPWPLLFLFVGVAGLGAGLVEPCVGTIILTAIKDKQAAAMSKVEVAYGLGALFMPLLSGFLISRGIWPLAFLVLGLSAFLLMIGWKRLNLESLDELMADQESREKTGNETRTRYRDKSLLFIALAAVYFFFYGGSEMSIVNFMPAIFAENWQIANSLAAISVTLYWSGMVIGRALTGIVSEKMTYHRFLRMINIGSLLSLIMLAMSGSVWAGFALCFLAGLFMAGMFAIALIITNQFFPGKTEQTTSILLASNGLGGAMLPVAMGWSLDDFPVQTAFWILIVLGVIMLFLVLVLRVLESGKSRILKKSENSGVKSM
ncbi:MULTISPECIES: MFS transporter [Bacillus]|uniref:MFS transporter n=1 Tax=Bacillus glycinifermentans TaxID=1664069 RepID=A0AAJ3YV45_9BACI|nr:MULTISPECIES: MFS transporter [Bacillus]KKB75471.1 MFS transporter [Bacillus sp. TH008]MDU0071158.1 MFS transporter [Bacillus sp. IG6]MED8019026.1 MFS transporter [Bacillus glycinifermentans]QAT63784.1 MFS transporter [Bacillus glycinifermentans]WKB77658.1 MFS transporter [Bacillus glycinifermentans]